MHVKALLSFESFSFNGLLDSPRDARVHQNGRVAIKYNDVYLY
jgi:hypothetical protein